MENTILHLLSSTFPKYSCRFLIAMNSGKLLNNLSGSGYDLHFTEEQMRTPAASFLAILVDRARFTPTSCFQKLCALTPDTALPCQTLACKLDWQRQEVDQLIQMSYITVALHRRRKMETHGCKMANEWTGCIQRVRTIQQIGPGTLQSQNFRLF